jgi:transcriptional regulator with XRE-family HTH domain
MNFFIDIILVSLTIGESMLSRGELIRLLRRRKGWTQRELAQRAGVTQTTIVRLERGDTEPVISTIRKVAEALGVPPAEILGEGAALAEV